MTAHVPSDDRAILAAHDQRFGIQAAAARAAMEALIANPTSEWHLDKAKAAAHDVFREGIATMHREVMDLRAAQRLPSYADLMLLDCKP